MTDRRLEELYTANPVLKESVARFFEETYIDRNRIETFQLSAELSQHRTKYAADYEFWVAKNMQRALFLGLDKPPRHLTILDLGCGGAIFPAIATYFGHQVIATDHDLSDPTFSTVAEAQGIARQQLTVSPFTSLPDLGKKFDLITGFATCFNHDYENHTSWGAGEWDHLLTDIRLNQLKAGSGRLFLQLNIGLNNETEVTQDVRDIFEKHHGNVNGSLVSLVNSSPHIKTALPTTRAL